MPTVEELIERTAEVMKARKRQATTQDAAERKKSAMHVVDFLKAHSGDNAARRVFDGVVLSEEEILTQLAAKVGTLDAAARAGLKCAVLRVFSSAEEASGPLQPHRLASTPLARACRSMDHAPKSHSAMHVTDFLQKRNEGNQASPSVSRGPPQSDEQTLVLLKADTSDSTGSGTLSKSKSAINVKDFLCMQNDCKGVASDSPRSNASGSNALIAAAKVVSGPSAPPITESERIEIQSALQSNVAGCGSALSDGNGHKESDYRLDAGGDGDY